MMHQMQISTGKRNIVELPVYPIHRFYAGGTHLSHWFDYTTRPLFALYNRHLVLILAVRPPNIFA